MVSRKQIYFISFLLALIPIFYFSIDYNISTNIYLFIFIISFLFLSYLIYKKAAILKSPFAVMLIILFAPGGILAIIIMLIVNYFKGNKKMERTISDQDIQLINKNRKIIDLRIKDRRRGNTVIDPYHDRRKKERRRK